jgi:3'(2'), 5'-bisphosphate nucleotidase
MPIPEIELSAEMTKVMNLAVEAGEVLKMFHKTGLKIDYKIDEFDPVSTADRQSDELLRTGIAEEFPGDKILSEESSLRPESYEGRVWMIDPLDDTKGYLAGRDTAGVMIGLLENGTPKLGVVYLPFRDLWYFAEKDKGAYRVANGVKVDLKVPLTRTIDGARLVGRNVIAGDTRPIDDIIAILPFGEIVVEGCIGAKIGLIAEGRADAFIHTNLKAGKWDTLAAELILSEAGGVMCDIDGTPLDYLKSDSSWQRYFVAACTSELLQEIVGTLKDLNEETHTF